MAAQLTSSLTVGLTLCLMAGLPMAAAGQGVAARLTPLLDSAPLDRNHWGIAVLDPRGRLVYGRNADRLFMPASNTKLVVTAAATALLGPASTVRSSLYAAGPVTNGTVTGDLVLYGRGDPGWSSRCFAVDTLAPGACGTDPAAALRAAVGALRRRGIERIAGRVVGDGSWFEPTLVHPTWENDDLPWGYAAPVSALGFNENLVTVTVSPTTPGLPASVSIEPDLGALIVDNRVSTARPGERTRITWSRAPGSDIAVARGVVATGGAPARAELAVPDPNRFAALALAAVLSDSGIVVLGGVGATTDSTRYLAARNGEALAEITSRPTSDWVFRVLNVSQNWIAEMLLKRLGREQGDGGSWSAGIEAERRFLIDVAALDSTQFLLHDGSGLSAKNAVTPLGFAGLLHFMRSHPDFEAFAAGLPRSGSLGTLRTRYVGTRLEGRVRAKTGSIGQVNTLSGFIGHDDPGRAPCRTFSVQANHHGLGGRAMIAAIDSVVVRIGQRTGCSRRLP